MDEETWLLKTQLASMLRYVRRVGFSERKACLAGVAFCRRLWELPFERVWHEAIEVVEQLADSATTAGQVEAVGERVNALRGQPGALVHGVDHWQSFTAVYLLTCFARGHFTGMGWHFVGWHIATSIAGRQIKEIRGTQCRVVRDIFGNPFRPVTFEPDWRTSTAVALAKQMYESRDFSTMPILADALQDAGCDNEDVLTHCRDAAGVHVRGCWVVDLVLGKS